jgi:hypothetical protein
LAERHSVVHPDFAPTRSPPPPLPAETNNKPKVKGIVARGKTVHMATGKQIQVGYDATEGKPVYTSEIVAYGPGKEVELPVSEAARLRKLGFLVGPAKVVTDEEAARLPSHPVLGDMPGPVTKPDFAAG